MPFRPDAPPGTIVLIEDDEAVLALLRDVLEADGFQVKPFAQPFEALALVRREAPAVVVLDWHLPQINGQAVIDHLREYLGALPPVLLITGDVRLRPPPEVSEVLRKPVSLTLFVDHVRALASGEATAVRSRLA